MTGSIRNAEASSANSGPSFAAVPAGGGPGVTTIEIRLEAPDSDRAACRRDRRSRALAVPHGSSRTVTGPSAADRPENRAVAPSLRSGSRKKAGTSASSRIEPVQREAAVADLAAARSSQDVPAFHPPVGLLLSMSRLKTQASRTGWPSGPTTRPRTVAPRRSARSTSWSGPPGFRSTAR